MRKDPIVEEVRKAGNRLARKYGYDLHKLCEHFRKTEREFEANVVLSNGQRRRLRRRVVERPSI
jgi:hypothetical protein